ncbi:MAG TPA: phage holin family protein [Candidatus Limnocylindrales bacterium]|nr:phage holin family protein [Candidatus Limnocylindrales bacterium]
MTNQSTAELVRQASEQISTLVRDELQNAKAELAEKGRHAGMGIGLFGGAAVMLHYALGALLFAAGLGLAEVMPGWAAALVVAAVLLVIAGIEALVGRFQLKRSTPLIPDRTIDSVRADVETVKAAVEERKRR